MAPSNPGPVLPPAAQPAPALAIMAVLVWMASAAAARWIGLWAAFGSTAVVLAAIIWLLAPGLRRGLFSVAFTPLILGTLAGVVLALASWLVHPIAVGALPWLARDTAGLYASFAALPTAQAALALPPVVLGEELIWRGLVHGALLARRPARVAIPLGAGLYALANLPTGSPALVLAALAGGLVWTALRIHTGGLIAPVASHLTWNVLMLFVRPLASV